MAYVVLMEWKFKSSSEEGIKVIGGKGHYGIAEVCIILQHIAQLSLEEGYEHLFVQFVKNCVPHVFHNGIATAACYEVLKLVCNCVLVFIADALNNLGENVIHVSLYLFEILRVMTDHLRNQH